LTSLAKFANDIAECPAPCKHKNIGALFFPAMYIGVPYFISIFLHLDGISSHHKTHSTSKENNHESF